MNTHPKSWDKHGCILMMIMMCLIGCILMFIIHSTDLEIFYQYQLFATKHAHPDESLLFRRKKAIRISFLKMLKICFLFGIRYQDHHPSYKKKISLEFFLVNLFLHNMYLFHQNLHWIRKRQQAPFAKSSLVKRSGKFKQIMTTS